MPDLEITIEANPNTGDIAMIMPATDSRPAPVFHMDAEAARQLARALLDYANYVNHGVRLLPVQ